jgi:RNA polymerase sigma-70 factor (ECF subfamily)
MSSDAPDVRALLERAAQGDAESWQVIIQQHHDRLLRMVALRLDLRLQGRVDPVDVLQEAYLDAFRLLPDYLKDPQVGFFLWLRSLAGTRLAKTHRHHLGAQQRDVRREVSLCRGGFPEASSAALAARLLGREERPSEMVARAELKRQLEQALNEMEEMDREVLVLRHFEQLTSAETAQALDISTAAAGKRYLRALARLRDIMKNHPEIGGGP